MKDLLGGFGYSALHLWVSLAVTDTDDIFHFFKSKLVEAESGVAGNLTNFLVAGYPLSPVVRYPLSPVVRYPLSPVVNENVDESFEYTTAIECLDSDPYHIDHPKTSYRTLGAC